jgi:glyceraldehyde 3-phosphate dehydrogenase
MAIRVGINGFGRIGRNVFRACLGESKLEFVAVNDITNSATLAHLLKHDSIHGTLKDDVKAEGDALVVGGKSVKVLAERDPSKLPWKSLGVDLVLECSGIFTERDKAAAHLTAGAEGDRLAPSKGADLMVCYGVNHTTYDPRSTTSSRTRRANTLPGAVAKVLQTFGINAAS